MTSRKGDKWHKLTEDQDRHLAIDYLHGAMSINQLAQRYQISYQGMRNHLQSRRFKEILAIMEQRVVDTAARHLAWHQSHLPDYDREVTEIALTRGDPKQTEMLRLGVQAAIPQVNRLEIEDNTTVKLEGALAESLNETLQALLEHRKERAKLPSVTESRHILEGEAAVPDAAQVIDGEVAE